MKRFILTTELQNPKRASHSTLKTLRTGVNWCPAVSYHTVNQDTERNPEDEWKHDDRAHYVISQKLPWWRGEVKRRTQTINTQSNHKTNFPSNHIPVVGKQPAVNDLPNVLMSSLSIKSHNRSITSCTCFIHFPCDNKGTLTLSKSINPLQCLLHFISVSRAVICVGLCLDPKEKKLNMTVSAGHSRPHHRSPQCRVFLCEGKGNCHWSGWRECRCHLFLYSTLYRNPPFLQT